MKMEAIAVAEAIDLTTDEEIDAALERAKPFVRFSWDATALRNG